MRFAPRRILAVLGVLAALQAGCESDPQAVRIVAQDYRFVPTFVRLEASRPFTLSILNEGREPHEFISRLLTDPDVKILSPTTRPDSAEMEALRILPGREIRLTIAAPPGTYLYRCRIRGHSAMHGTIVLEPTREGHVVLSGRKRV